MAGARGLQGCAGIAALRLRQPARRRAGKAVTFPPVQGMLSVAAASTTRRRFSICQKRSGCRPGDGVKMTHARYRQRSNRLQIGCVVAPRSLTRSDAEPRGRASDPQEPLGPWERRCPQHPPRRCSSGGWFAPAPWREGDHLSPPPRSHAVPLTGAGTHRTPSPARPSG